MKNPEKLSLIRIGLGDYARSNSGPLYKEILAYARKRQVVSASVFRSIDSMTLKGNPEIVRLFGGQDKSQAIIIEIIMRQKKTEAFLSELRENLQDSKDPVLISVLEAKVEVFGQVPEILPWP